MNSHTPTWIYVASGLNFLIENKIWEIEDETEYGYYKIPEGVRLILIISFASVVEGALKTYLIETIDKGLPDRNSFENVTIMQVENETWNNLIGFFKKIKKKKLKKLLNDKKKNLFEDVEMIFKFRNFIIHSNNIKHQVNNENDFNFQEESDTFSEYLIRNKLIERNYKNEGKYFVEYLMPEKLIHHFKKVVDEYLGIDFFSEHFTTANLRNLIYNEIAESSR